jgi:DNA-binding transcriptional MerR regulator
VAEVAETAMTIEELARRSGMTVRNIRAHQSRGLLPPPEMRGRTGFYGAEHLDRLRLIASLQSQGFNLAAIGRLLEMGEAGGAEARFGEALTVPFGDERPEVIGERELARVFGGRLDPAALARAEEQDVIRRLDNGDFEVLSPTLLRAAGELVRIGVPIDDVLSVGDEIRHGTDAIAAAFVRMFVASVLDAPPGAGAPGPGEAVERMRPLATGAVLAGFQRAMAAAIERSLERVSSASAPRSGASAAGNGTPPPR